MITSKAATLSIHALEFHVCADWFLCMRHFVVYVSHGRSFSFTCTHGHKKRLSVCIEMSVPNYIEEVTTILRRHVGEHYYMDLCKPW